MRFGDAFAADAHVIQVDLAEGPTHPRVDSYLRGDAGEIAAALLAALPGALAAVPGAGSIADRTGPTAVPQSRPAGDALAPDGRLDPRSADAPPRRDPARRPRRRAGRRPLHRLGSDLPDDPGTGPADHGGYRVPDDRARTAERRRRRDARVPESTIVLCSGDGGALMGLADLETVVRSVRRGVIADLQRRGLRRRGAPVRSARHRRAPDADPRGRLRGHRGGARCDSRRSSANSDDLAPSRPGSRPASEGVFLADLRVSREVVAPYMHEVVAAATGHTDRAIRLSCSGRDPPADS